MIAILLEKFEPLTSFWFWLSFWGNVFTITFASALLRLTTPQTLPTDVDVTLLERMKLLRVNGRPLYYIAPIWCVAALAAFRALKAFFYKIESIDPEGAINQYLIGIMFAGAWYFYGYGSGKLLNADLARKVLNGVIVMIIIAFGVMGWLGFRLAIRRANDLQQESNELRKREVKTDSTVAGNTAAFDTLKGRVGRLDTTTQRIDTTTQMLLKRK